MKIHIFVRFCILMYGIYTMLLTKVNNYVRTFFTVCISTFLPFIENRCLEYQVIEKAHHVAHNETVGILSKKAQEKV